MTGCHFCTSLRKGPRSFPKTASIDYIFQLNLPQLSIFYPRVFFPFLRRHRETSPLLSFHTPGSPFANRTGSLCPRFKGPFRCLILLIIFTLLSTSRLGVQQQSKCCRSTSQVLSSRIYRIFCRGTNKPVLPSFSQTLAFFVSHSLPNSPTLYNVSPSKNADG